MYIMYVRRYPAIILVVVVVVVFATTGFVNEGRKSKNAVPARYDVGSIII